MRHTMALPAKNTSRRRSRRSTVGNDGTNNTKNVENIDSSDKCATIRCSIVYGDTGRNLWCEGCSQQSSNGNCQYFTQPQQDLQNVSAGVIFDVANGVEPTAPLICSDARTLRYIKPANFCYINGYVIRQELANYSDIFSNIPRWPSKVWFIPCSYPLQYRVELVHTNTSMGLGLKALEKIREGVFICEYVGRLITKSQLNQLNDLEGRADYIANNGRYYIDGYECGNAARFINHSCNSNVKFVRKVRRVDDPRALNLFVQTKRVILPNEWITVDYGDEYLKDLYKKANILCQCGEKQCRRNVIIDANNVRNNERILRRRTK